MLSSCGHSSLEDEELSELQGTALPVVITVNIPSEGSVTRATEAEILQAESTIKLSEFYVATYKADGTLIENLVEKGNSASASVTFINHPVLGPTIHALLDRENHTEYTGNFFIAAFTVDPDLNSSFALNNIANTQNVTLSHPFASDVWAPTSDLNQTKGRIPMAGCLYITQQWLENVHYTSDESGVPTLQLPSINMIRSMAKIVIEDKHGIITKAECRHRAKGNILPKANHSSNFWWIPLETDQKLYDWQSITPNAVSGTNDSDFLTQTFSTENPTEENKIIFYSYESGFNNLGTDGTLAEFNSENNTDSRAMIRLTGKGTLGTKTVYIAPYEDGKVKTANYAGLTSGEDGYVWSGLLRNHCYTFTVHKPANGEMQIYVKATKWKYERVNFDY